ncbi:MAG: hypothetical protein FJ360_01590 [Thaumarchaeota archaeon]|nr:hypothetical protein [Nitrososphaerota archaeon]
MVEVEYKPIKKIIVHEFIKYDLKQFIELKSSPPQPVRWIDGIVFQILHYGNSPKLTDDEIEGIVHWAAVEFAEMSEYKPALPTSISTITIPVIDNSSNTAVSDVIRWIKKQPQWKN